MTRGGCQHLPWLVLWLELRSITPLSLIKLCLPELDPTWQSSCCKNCWNLIAPFITRTVLGSTKFLRGLPWRILSPAGAEEGTDLELGFPSLSQCEAAGAGSSFKHGPGWDCSSRAGIPAVPGNHRALHKVQLHPRGSISLHFPHQLRGT